MHDGGPHLRAVSTFQSCLLSDESGELLFDRASEWQQQYPTNLLGCITENYQEPGGKISTKFNMATNMRYHFSVYPLRPIYPIIPFPSATRDFLSAIGIKACKTTYNPNGTYITLIDLT